MRTVIAYLRRRTRLWSAAGLWAGILLIAFNLYAAVIVYIPEYQVRNDFRLIYGAARVALQQGFSHVYDLDAQKAATEALAIGATLSRNPVPCEGSDVMGKCDSFLRLGIAEISSVLRV